MKTERIANDFYPTAAALTEAVLDRFPIPKSATCIDPCGGDLAIVEVLRKRGIRTWSNDIATYGFSHDFYLDATDPTGWERMNHHIGGIDWVVTNPPFNLAAQILPLAYQHSLMGMLALLRITYAEPCPNRAEWLQANADQQVLFMPVNPRPKFRADKNGSDSATTAWMAWDKRWSWKQMGIPAPFDYLSGWKK